MTDQRRLRAVPISPDLLTEFLTQGWEVGQDRFLRCTFGLPPGAILAHSDYDPHTHTTYFVYWHESFEPVELGARVPVLVCTYESREKAPTWHGRFVSWVRRKMHLRERIWTISAD
jgi:hypothetical protein